MTIHIQEPWWGAWKRFGWAKSIPGIGIDSQKVAQAIDKQEQLILRIGKESQLYRISPVTVRNVCAKYNSTFKARYNKTLLVVPQSELVKYEATDSDKSTDQPVSNG